ncbi:MAG: NACHT domain-containing protein [Chloroflexaceae bacterium]|nr:NACHT domain-containing protein [Chloroflexaceae bacterium]
MPALALQQVYVSLTTGNDIPGERFVIDADTLLAELEAGDPEQVPAEAVRLASVGAQSGTADQQQQTGVGLERNGIVPSSYQQLARQALPAQLSGCWYRPELVIEAIANCSRLVLLGAPGSGKTTILHYLVVTLAQRLLQRDQSDASAVWRHHVDQLLQPGIPIPIFCSLGRVAAQFGHDPSADIHTLLVTLLSSVVETTRWVVPSTTVLLAWRQGHVILCFDGLDDVSNVLVETSRGLLSPRQRMVKALDQLSDQVGRSRMVVTCRTPAYHQYASARLSDTWRIRTIQPLHMGQVRQFITTWHQNVSQLPQSPWTPDAAQARARDLLRTLEHLPGLRELTTSPLLLTMLVLLDYHARECTAARVDMYEELVQLLLERWHLIRTTRHEQQAQPTSDRHGLEQINRSNLRSIIHEIAFEAHRSTSSGPGGLSVAAMRQRIDHFLPGRSIQRHLGGCPVRSMWR